MNGAILEKIYNARAQIRAAGKRDTQDAVRALIGGSKSTLVKYWHKTDPATYAPPPVTADPVTITAPHATAGSVMREPSVTAGSREVSTPVNGTNGDVQSNHYASPASPTDADFEASFEVLMQARIRFMACQEIPGDNRLLRRLARDAYDVLRDGVHGMPSDHPLVQAIVDDYDEKYDAHIDLWKQMVEPSQYAYHGWREPEPQVDQAPEPEPEPEPPAFDMANLKKYYFDRARSPWPTGGMPRPPKEVYPVMQALWKEASNEISRADRQHYDVLNELSQQRVMDIDHHPALVQNGTRRSLARGVLNAIQADMDNVRQWAHRDGVELPDPRLS